MHTQTVFRTFAYSLILIGCILAFVSAVVPYYSAGYKLIFSVLLSGLLPYLIYGIAAPFLSGWLLALPGIILVILHSWLVVSERLLNDANYSNGMIYYVPLALAVFLLPLVVLALREPWGAEPEIHAEHAETSQ